MKNYYNILKINKSSSHKEVKSAYISALKPFINKSNFTYEEKKKIKDIKRAYFILGDYHNRRKYDDYLENQIPTNQIISRSGIPNGIFSGSLNGLATSFFNHMNEPRFNFPTINLETEIKDIKGTSKSRYYVHSQSSIGKTNNQGQYTVQTKTYTNDNGKINKDSKNYTYNKNGKL